MKRSVAPGCVAWLGRQGPKTSLLPVALTKKYRGRGGKLFFVIILFGIYVLMHEMHELHIHNYIT